MTFEERMAQDVTAAFKTLSTPLMARLFAVESRVKVADSTIAGLTDTIADLRARLLAAEAKSLVPGPMGPAGPAGEPGAPGRDGKDGDAGARGEKGLDGAPGRDGKDGAQGPAGPRGEKGLDGRDGKDGVAGINGTDGAPGVNGKDGAPGRDGVNGEAGPRGEKGIDGVPGRDGKDGAPGPRGDKGQDGVNGKDGVSGLNGKDAQLPDIAAMVKAEVAQWPLPKDGRSVTVEELSPLVKSVVDQAVAALPRPAEPIHITGALIERDGTLVLTQSDGGTKRVGVVVGKDGADGRPGTDVSPEHIATLIKAAVDQIPRPKDGKDGADGIGFDDLDLAFDEQKGFVLRCVRGAMTKEWPIPTPYYVGVWQSGRTYAKGATVTATGDLWIALRDTSASPRDESGESRDWRLIVRRGRDGKPGRDGRDGSLA